MTPEDALARAKEVLGGDSEIGRLLGVSKQAVQQWTICPKKHVVVLVDAMITAQAKAIKAANRPVPMEYQLRPDHFQRPKR